MENLQIRYYYNGVPYSINRGIIAPDVIESVHEWIRTREREQVDDLSPFAYIEVDLKTTSPGITDFSVCFVDPVRR